MVNRGRISQSLNPLQPVFMACLRDRGYSLQCSGFYRNICQRVIYSFENFDFRNEYKENSFLRKDYLIVMNDQFTIASPSFRKAISHQIELIKESKDFNATPKQIAFLKFVVNQTLEDKGGEINEYKVAVEVFGRGPDFDKRIDPIVSIQADILRRKLERYYLTAKNDPIRIDIPDGTYVPVFKKR